MKELIDIIFSGKNVVVVTGAGISTLSGIPDFRGKNGIYNKDEDVEYKLSKRYFLNNSKEFYDFYKDNMIVTNVKPNIIHNTLVKLEKKGFISGIITQNIDNLHQEAGSKNVIDLHGNGKRFYCCDCGKEFDESYYINHGFECDECDGVVRPDIVLYGENLKNKVLSNSIEMIENADIVIVLGSSLVVSTVAGLLKDYLISKKIFDSKDTSLYIVNNQSTSFDGYAKRISDDLESVFEEIMKRDELNEE